MQINNNKINGKNFIILIMNICKMILIVIVNNLNKFK